MVSGNMASQVSGSTEGGFFGNAKRTQNPHSTVGRRHKMILEFPATIKFHVTGLAINFQGAVVHSEDGNILSFKAFNPKVDIYMYFGIKKRHK